jgi:hypothetical protein
MQQYYAGYMPQSAIHLLYFILELGVILGG